MRRLFTPLLLITVILSLSACGSTNTAPVSSVSPVTRASVAAGTDTAANTYANITPEDAKKRLDSETGIVLLDVRTQEEYAEKHIPNSMLIPVDVLEAQVLDKIPDKNTVLFVYCRSGNRSVTASEILVKLGYTQVYNLGGIKAWPYDTVSGQ